VYDYGHQVRISESYDGLGSVASISKPLNSKGRTAEAGQREEDVVSYLRINHSGVEEAGYGLMLGQLAVAEAMLAKKDNKAMQHFIAVVKELERIYNFTFETVEEDPLAGLPSSRPSLTAAVPEVEELHFLEGGRR
jgi:hypothetical protein